MTPGILGFAISTFIARYRRYIPVRQVTGTQSISTFIARYRRYIPVYQKLTISGRLKGEIDCQRSTKGEIDRRQSIEREKGKKKRKKEKKRKEEKKNTFRDRPCVVAARAPSPPAGRGRIFSLPYRYRDELGTPVWIAH
ncbi:hypothetical protein BHM03_00003639, partial [Ensete ventricosum]